MSPTEIMVITLISLMVFRIPIAFSMGISVLIFLWLSDKSLRLIPQYLIANLDSFTLLAIPFFLLAGEFMARGGLAQRLISFAKVFVGHIPGGLGQVNCLSSVIFATMSGSASADAAATSRILVPAMEREGYSRGYAAAITAASATVGPIIPPSIHLVLVGAINELSIGRLFLGGIIPGLLMAGGLMVYVYSGYGRRNVVTSPRASFQQFKIAFKESFWAMLTPPIILGGIFLGIFTPTEAAICAVVYSGFIGKFIYNELTWNDVGKSIIASLDISARLMLIVAIAGVFGWILSSEKAAQDLVIYIKSIAHNKYLLLLLLNILLLLLGMFINLVTLIILLSPILYPLVIAFGIDPIHFSLIFVLNLMIGQLTPPVALMSFVVISVTECSLEDFLKSIWPMIVVLVAVLILVTYYPATVLWLPRLIMP